MGISTLYIGLLLVLLVLFFAIGVYLLLGQKGKRERPSRLSLAVLGCQVVFLVLFFSASLANFNELIFDASLLALILLGVVCTVKESRNNAIIAWLLSFATILFVAFLPISLLLSRM